MWLTQMSTFRHAHKQQTLSWILGRGISMGCGLTWSVPVEWCVDSRDVLIDRIKRQIRQEMSRTDLNTNSLNDLMSYLALHTQLNWRHRFHTTNWDYLLQIAMDQHLLANAKNSERAYKPRWLADSHVFHINGTAEYGDDATIPARRSAFVLETDKFDRLKDPPLELMKSLDQFAWGNLFVASGISFECEPDRQIFRLLNLIENSTPVGESHWILVNPDTAANAKLGCVIKSALPDANIHTRNETFATWLKNGLPELVTFGVLKQLNRERRIGLGVSE